MPLNNTDWIRNTLLMGRQIHPGNDINYGYYHDKCAFEFCVSELKRAEFNQGKNSTILGQTYTYTGSLYIPSDEFDRPIGSAIVMQWHDNGQHSNPAGPPLTLKCENDDFVIRKMWDVPEFEYAEIARWPIEYDNWLDFEFIIKWRNDHKGVVQLNFNGEQLLYADGANCFTEDFAPYWKFGCYRIGTHDIPFPTIVNYWSNTLLIRHRN